jgi:hypothetical protein
MNNTITVLTGLVALTIGGGGGGLIGALVMWRKSKSEMLVAERTTVTEQFNTLFPAGLGEAVEVYRNLSADLTRQLDEVRAKEAELHAENRRLSIELEAVKGKLARAERRIEHLERNQ